MFVCMYESMQALAQSITHKKLLQYQKYCTVLSSIFVCLYVFALYIGWLIDWSIN